MQYKILLTKEEIKEKVNKTAEEIVKYLKENEIRELTIMPIMNGSIFYAIDLMRQISRKIIETKTICNLQIETLRIKSYENNSNVNTKLICNDIDSINITDKNILIVDDVFDTGNTFKWLIDKLIDKNANIILCAVFIDKTCNHKPQYTPDFVSYTLNENKFLVGYGMDDNGYCREWEDLWYIVD